LKDDPMMKSYKRSLRSIAVLGLLVACATVTFGLAQTGTSYAQSSSARGVTDYKLPGGSDPWGTAFDSAGNVWVAAPGCDPQPRCAGGATPGKLDVFNPRNDHWLASISLPGNYGQPFFIAFDHSGQAWFSMPMTNTIGVYNPANNSFGQWALPSAASGPWDIAVDKSGKIWVTEHYGYKVASFNPMTHHFKEYATSSTISAPYGITVDGNNNVWFTENVDAVAKIGRISAHGHLTEYSIRNYDTSGTGLTPHMITVDASGDVWWSEGWVGSIAVLHVSAASPGTNQGVTEYQYNGNGNGTTHTSGISASPDGRIWLDDAQQNTVGYFDGQSFSFINVPGNHPHDGLNVDANGHVWFDEEFSNALGRAN
jgi:streptogramin lyase